MQSSNELQNWFMRLDRRLYAVLVGIAIGLLGGGIGLLIIFTDPLLAVVAVVGILAALYILTDVNVALYALISILLLLPFGIFPVKIGFKPSLIDLGMGAFLLVYLFQWMTGRRQQLRLTPVHLLLALYIGWLLLTYALGLRYAMPTQRNIREFGGVILAIGMTFVLVDLLRDPKMLRRLIWVIFIGIGIQALMAIILYALPDLTAESILVRLARLDYPNGGVIRYIEDNPALGERAIGTWIDPNTLGGVLAVAAAMLTPQVLAKKPVLRYRGLTLMVLGLVGMALFLTFSRSSFLAYGVSLFVLAVVRYRKLLPVLAIGAILFFILPQTQAYVDRLMQAFAGADLATQMRIGEWTDSLRLISRYPIFGVGFTGTPEIDIYTDVANMYLNMANQIGLVGVGIFLTTMAGIFIYGIRAWRYAKRDKEFDAIHLGYHLALLTALVNSIADLYYFRPDFQGPITWFWLVVALCLTSSRLALERYREAESDIVKRREVL